jgi:brefeldin A-resistance guanine nucleotide exchange factor 1
VDSKHNAKVVEEIASSVISCRFEATDPESDEVVLMRILQVLVACCKCPVGFLLSEEAVMDMIQTCYRMSSQSRLSGNTSHISIFCHLSYLSLDTSHISCLISIL